MTKSVRIELGAGDAAVPGNPNNTKIYDAQTGAKLQGFRRVEIREQVNDVRVAVVEFVMPEIVMAEKK